MEVMQGAAGGPQLLQLGAGVMALLLAVVAVSSLPSLMDYWRRWWVLKPIPGVSPCYPVLGNALLLERKGEGKGSSCHSPRAQMCYMFFFSFGTCLLCAHALLAVLPGMLPEERAAGTQEHGKAKDKCMPWACTLPSADTC
uniref:Uncharacterized protein n=1 Tax=Strigops habroptila TaxID=2489341 RepID=A0A672UK60_STRHB